MSTKAVLFDLDGTLLDTSEIESLRNARKWKECVARREQVSVFPGIKELLDHLAKKNIRIGVVTTSVSYYAESLLEYHGLAHATLVAYHDVSRKKPHPECVLTALTRLTMSPIEALGVGDTVEDCGAFSGAGVRAFAAGWNPRVNRDENWTGILSHPIDLVNHLS